METGSLEDDRPQVLPCYLHGSLAGALAGWAERTPHAAALEVGELVVTYRGLHRAVSGADGPEGAGAGAVIAECVGLVRSALSAGDPELAAALTWAADAFAMPAGTPGRARVALAIPRASRLTALDVLGALVLGGTLVVPARPLVASEGVTWLEAQRVSAVHLLPSMGLAWAAHAGNKRLPALGRVWFSGEPLAACVADTWRKLAPSAEIMLAYETAKAPFVSAYGPVGKPARSGVHPWDRPLPGVRLEVRGDGGALVSAGKIGEVTVEHPRLGPLRSGERGRLLADGRIEPIVSDGDAALERCEIAEIEAAAACLPGVAAVAVVRPEGETDEISLSAFVVGALEPSVWRDTVRGLMHEDAPHISLVALDSMPLAPDGRIDRDELRRRAASLRAAHREPKTPTESVVAKEWAELLGAGIGTDQDFFLVGGHSLLAAQLAARLSSIFALDVPLSVFFESTTIADQAAWIDRSRALEVVPLDHGPRRIGMPLSYAQEREWFFEELSPGTTVHHLQWLFEIEGPLDHDLLEKAMLAVAERHEALRTVFRRDANSVVQHVVVNMSRWHEEHDLRSAGASARTAAYAHSRLIFKQSFDLARGPLWRTAIFRCGAESHLMSINMHHIISDAVSLNRWIAEVSELYAAAKEGRAPVLPELPTQPATLAKAQRHAIASGALNPQRDFWRRTLAGIPAGVDLPADHPRPNQPTYRGVSSDLDLDLAVTDRLRTIARRHGATLFMALLAAVDLLVTRLSGETDVVVGTPLGGRDRADTRNLIGLFLNNVPIRVDVAGDPTYTELLVRCRDATKAALAHSALPFERILAEVSASPAQGRHPIFSVMLNMVPEASALKLQALSVQVNGTRNESSPIDLLLNFRELGDGSLVGDMRGSADLFEPESVARLVRRLQTVIAAVAQNPDTPISRVPLIAEEERRFLTATVNDTDAPAPARSVPELIEDAIRAAPDAVAFTQGAASWTFAELDRRANRIANTLVGRGIPREAPVAVLLNRGFDLPAALLGAMKARGAFILLDPVLPAARTQALLAASRPFAVLTERALAAHLPESLAARALFLDDPASLAAASEERIAPELLPPPTPDELAYIMFTSGSTGTPKGVMVPHRGLSNRLEWVRRLFPFEPGESVYQKTPLGFIDAIWELLAPMREGIRCALATPEVLHDPVRLAQELEHAGTTRIMLVPSLLRALLAAHRDKPGFLPKLTLWMVGGEELPIELVRELARACPDARLVNLYGLSEVSGEATWCIPGEGETGRVPIGVCGPSVRAYVLDAQGEPAPAGVWGELYIGGAGVARGYLDDEERTRERFRPDPFHPGGRMFKTGDRARRMSTGTLEYAGRLDQQIKVHGVRIDPSEIEDALRRMPEVLDAAVVARPSSAGTVTLVGYFVPKHLASPPRPSELRAELRRSLPEPMVPTVLMPLAGLPLSPNSKIDRDALPEPVEPRAEDVRPKTSTEEALEELWNELLGTGPYSVEDDFFAKGGYSLLLGQLGIRIRATFLTAVPFTDLFRVPTLGAQARCIEESLRHGVHALHIERVPREPRMPVSFAQERMWFGAGMKSHALQPVVVVAQRYFGELDVDRLETSMEAIAVRHEALRTTFSAQQGVPHQTVHAAMPGKHRRLDLSNLAEADALATLDRLHQAEYETPFDLGRGPPWRSTYVRIGAAHHALLVTMSHLVSDGTSVRRWIEELGVHYVTPPGEIVDVPALTLQPADYAAWQRRSVAQGTLDSGRAYWRELLGASPPPAELPADGPRIPGDSAAWVQARLSSTALLRLRELARVESTTLFTALTAGVAALVAEVTNDPVTTIGALVGGREHPEIDPLVGLFLNTVPIRLDVGGAGSFVEVLRRARTVSQEALVHSTVPFERIVADVNAGREPGRNPLFDVAVNFVPRYPNWRLGELGVRSIDPPQLIPSPFDLMWRLVQRMDGLHVYLEYRRSRFSEERARGWLQRYVAILDDAASR